MSRKSDQGPLLYIVQPFSRTPSNHNMQEVYTNKRELEQTYEQETTNDDKRKRPQQKKGMFQEFVPIELSVNASDQYPPPKEENNRPSFTRVKPFKEMNLMERLDYLSHFPKVLPPVPCVFSTANRTYQGFLLDYQDHEVTIQMADNDQTNQTIPVSELTNVMMIGIKR